MASNCIASQSEAAAEPQVQVLRAAAAASLLKQQQPFVDLGMVCATCAHTHSLLRHTGYESLHSTPKQRLPESEKVELEDQQSNNETDTSFDNSIRWTDRFSLLKDCKLFKRLRKHLRPDDQSPGVGDGVRVEWDKKMDFLLSIIGFAVDLANVSTGAGVVVHNDLLVLRYGDSLICVIRTAAESF